MRTRITTIIILIAVVLLIFTMCNGIEIGKFKILSVSELIEKNDTLSEKIEEAKNITSDTYLENEEALEETFQQYKIQKQKYEGLIGVSTEEDEKKYETKQYDIEYLWRILGAYAKETKFQGDPGVSVGLDVKKSNIGKSVYDFNFTVTGSYTRISQFITDIENDSDLYFRIYNFKMTDNKEDKGNTESVVATFTVKNINVDSSTITQTTTITKK